MPSGIRVTEETYNIFNSIKKTLEEKAKGPSDITPTYTQSDVLKIICQYYKIHALEETT